MSEKLRRFPVPFRPMPKPALGEALLTEPETKLVVDQDLDSPASIRNVPQRQLPLCV